MADLQTVTIRINGNPNGYDPVLIAAAIRARLDERDPRPIYEEILGYDPYNHQGSNVGRQE